MPPLARPLPQLIELQAQVGRVWRWQDKQSPVLGVVPWLPRPEGEGPRLPGSLAPCHVWAPGRNVGVEGRQKDLGCGAHIPLPEPQDREGQLGLEAPRADSDLLLALVGSREESLAESRAGGRAALCCWSGLEGSGEIWRDQAAGKYVPSLRLTSCLSLFGPPRTQFLDIEAGPRHQIWTHDFWQTTAPTWASVTPPVK